ncbi:hypothetical protein [Mycoplasma phocimorsus]|uniref:hypothetical protein n=1 Tax=Mycoplasma phocimorsus TaxID=3045839 RepID=UPI0024C07C08|nr:hypothetical protein [Mycoplasma phocimorsus]MDJ1647120.1 hypothetical protein [Mycoplasma phocimorsus]
MTSYNYAIIMFVLFFSNILIILIIPLVLYWLKFKYEFEIFQFIYKVDENRIRRIDKGIKAKSVINKFVFKPFLDFEWHSFDSFIQELNVTNRFKIQRIIDDFSIEKNSCLLRQLQGKYELSFYKIQDNIFQINIRYSNNKEQHEIIQISQQQFKNNNYIAIVSLNVNIQKFQNLDNIFHLLSNHLNTCDVYTYTRKRFVNLIIFNKNKHVLKQKMKKFIFNNNSLFTYLCADDKFKYFSIEKIQKDKELDSYFSKDRKISKSTINKKLNTREVKILDDIIYKYKTKKPFARIWRVKLNDDTNDEFKYNILRKKIYDRAVNHLKIIQNNNKIDNFLLLESIAISKNILNHNKHVFIIIANDSYFEDNYKFLKSKNLPISIYIKDISESILDNISRKNHIKYVFIDHKINIDNSYFKKWFLYNLMIISKIKNFKIVSYVNNTNDPLYYSEYAIKYYIN